MRPGARVGPYEIVALLGSGGAGAVFRARSAQGEVALKVLHRNEAEAAARFERERRLLAGFGEAEGFVPLRDAGTANGVAYIVMPLLDGGTLRDRLDAGRLAVGEVFALGDRLARALGRAHAKGIVHRDVKPENVLFAQRGDPRRALVADLGLAKHFAPPEGARSLSLSRTGVFRGTAGYMPAEQMTDAKSIGPPADVFALGAVLYECLAGRPAFSGETPLELMAAVATTRPPSLARLRADVPPRFAKVIERALAKDPAARFADGDAFAAAIEAARAPEKGARRGVLALVALGLLITAGGVAVALRGRPLDASKGPPPVSSPQQPIAKTPRAAPDLARGFRSGPGFKLAGTWGRFDWKTAAEVYRIAASPDGRRIVTAGEEPVVHAWDAASGAELWSFEAPGAERFFALAFSPRGDRVLVGGSEASLRILDAATGELVGGLDGHGGPVHTVAWSSRDDRVLTAGGPAGDGERATILLRDPRSGEVFGRWSPHDPLLHGLALSPDGAHVYAVGNEGKLLAFDATNAASPPVVLGSNLGRVTGFDVSEDGRRCFTATVDGGVIARWDLEHGRRRPDFAERAAGEAFGVGCSTDGAIVGAACRDGVRCWRDEGDAGARLLWHAETLGGRAGTVSRDGTRVFSGHFDGVIRAWDAATGTEVSRVDGLAGAVRSLACTKEGVLAATFDAEHVAIATVDSTARPVVGRLGSYLGCLALSPDGALALVSLTPHPTTRRAAGYVVVDTKTARMLWRGTNPFAPVTAVAFAVDRPVAAVGRADGDVTVIDLETKETMSLPVLREKITALGFIEGSTMLAVCGERGTVQFTSMEVLIANGAPLRDPEPAVTAIVTRGRLALTGDAAGGVKTWDTTSRVRIDAAEKAHGGAIEAAALAPDGALAATSGADGTIAIWQLSPLKLKTRIDLATSTDRPTALAFEGPRRLRVGTARGVVHAFELER